MLYTENDLTQARLETRKILLQMLVPAVLLMGGVIWSFVVRIKWLTILLSILTGFWIIFIRQNFWLPRQAYSNHIDSALHAKKKEAEGRYLRTEDTPVERNNVMFYAFYLNIGEKEDPDDDRLFYWDALKPRPDWQTGDRIRICSYDKFVSSYQVIARGDAPAI